MDPGYLPIWRICNRHSPGAYYNKRVHVTKVPDLIEVVFLAQALRFFDFPYFILGLVSGICCVYLNIRWTHVNSLDVKREYHRTHAMRVAAHTLDSRQPN
jgi:hypothetical protein